MFIRRVKLKETGRASSSPAGVRQVKEEIEPHKDDSVEVDPTRMMGLKSCFRSTKEAEARTVIETAPELGEFRPLRFDTPPNDTALERQFVAEVEIDTQSCPK